MSELEPPVDYKRIDRERCDQWVRASFAGSEVVTDIRCTRPRGHEGACAFRLPQVMNVHDGDMIRFSETRTITEGEKP